MASTKAVREAQAALDALLAERAKDQAALDAAEAAIKPLSKKVETIIARRRKVAIVSDTGGNFWLGSLANIRAESFGAERIANELGTGPKGVKAIADALTEGKIKVAANSGVSLTLRGITGRVRRPDKAALRAFERARKARIAAEQRTAKARQAEVAAIRAVFDTGAKIAADELLSGIVEHAVAGARYQLAPKPHELRRKVETFDSWEGAPLRVAQDHLAFAKSGADGPCPCANCAAARRKEEQIREATARLDALPTVMHECPLDGHGRHRLAFEHRDLRLTSDWRTKLAGTRPELADLLPADPNAWSIAVIAAPTGWCRKDPRNPVAFVLTERLAAELRKAARKRPAQGGVTFICPDPECGETGTSPVDDENGVTCPACEAWWRSDAVKVVKPAKVA